MKAQTNYGLRDYRTIRKFQIIPRTFPFIELLAIKMSAFEISKQLKNIIKVSKSIKNDYVTLNYQSLWTYMDNSYIVKRSGNSRKGLKISNGSKIHQNV